MIGTNYFTPNPNVPGESIALTDDNGFKMYVKGTNVPADTTEGYGKGCFFIKASGSLGDTIYLNEGDETSCDFNVAALPTGDITSVVAGAGLIGGAASGAATLDVGAGTGITVNANDIAIASSYLPTHVVKYAGKVTWSGGLATLASTVSGVAATDIVQATIEGAPTETAFLASAAPTLNTITFTLSAANTSNDAVIAYTVFRAV